MPGAQPSTAVNGSFQFGGSAVAFGSQAVLPDGTAGTSVTSFALGHASSHAKRKVKAAASRLKKWSDVSETGCSLAGRHSLYVVYVDSYIFRCDFTCRSCCLLLLLLLLFFSLLLLLFALYKKS